MSVASRKSILSSFLVGGVLGGILFLLIAFIITQLGDSFSSEKQVKSTIAMIFFEYPTLIFQTAAGLLGYKIASSILFFCAFAFYVVTGGLINIVWTKFRN